MQGMVFNNPDFIVKVYENKTAYAVELSPVGKGLKEFIKTINIIVSKNDYAVNTIEMDENSGDNTTLHFTNREVNAAIPDALFAIR